MSPYSTSDLLEFYIADPYRKRSALEFSRDPRSHAQRGPKPVLFTFLALVVLLLPGLALGGGNGSSGKSDSKSSKVELCHCDDEGGLNLIEVNENAVDSHFTNHGDFYPAIFYVDGDRDGYGVDDPYWNIEACEAREGYSTLAGDCDDINAYLNPDATEVCDEVDNNCDGDVDEGFDIDADGYTVCEGDCDDADEEVNPEEEELCDGYDNNCDSYIDEGFDLDQDGYASCGGDCDDDSSQVNPEAEESCDGEDNNCDGVTDEGFDQDEDGFSSCAGDCNDLHPDVNPDALETCDELDNDCDGVIDGDAFGDTSVCMASSCLDIKAECPDAGSGDYWLNFGEGEEHLFYCDMDTDGGGWTEVTLDQAYLNLNGNLVAVQAAAVAGIDDSHRPFTQDAEPDHTYHYTFEIPFGFEEFYLSGYHARAFGKDNNNKSDIVPADFVQKDWTCAGGNFRGDISFGSADDPGPVVSYGSVLFTDVFCWDCLMEWPGGDRIYSLSAESFHFRIGWGESGNQAEGWYPWWDGSIFVR